MDTRRILDQVGSITDRMNEVIARSETDGDLNAVAAAVVNLASCVEMIVEGEPIH